MPELLFISEDSVYNAQKVLYILIYFLFKNLLNLQNNSYSVTSIFYPFSFKGTKCISSNTYSGAANVRPSWLAIPLKESN